VKLFSLFKKNKPGSIYAFQKGVYAAKMFVLIYSETRTHHFLTLPDNLKTPILLGYNITLKCDISSALLKEIIDDKYRYLKFFDTIKKEYNYIWIRNISTNIVDGIAQIEGSEVLNPTALQGGYMEFMDGTGYIEFMDGTGYIEFMQKTA